MLFRNTPFGHAWGVQRENFVQNSFATAPLAIARIASRQRGLIRGWQLNAIGLDNAAITRWVRAGKLHRVYRGVYAVGHDALCA